MHYTYEWLTRQFDSGEPLRFIFFWGHNKKPGQDVGQFVLSQWFPSPFTVDGIVYPTSEHWMMAWKASLFGDKIAFDKILAAKKPGEVKELGRQITGFDEIVWNKRRFEIVKTTSSNLPPWKKYPDINPLDMFWRMGTGEGYMLAFSNIFQGLSERDKKLYELSYPAMGDWAGFYSNEWWLEK